MEPFSTLSSTVVPLPLKDVDTDQIIPARYLTRAGKTGYDEGLFARLRAQEPEFPLNLPHFSEAKVLVTRANFGCGSSREHAVWALLDYGFRAVIAPSFADIFLSNSGKNGLVLVQLSDDVVEDILRDAVSGDYAVSIDLEKQVITLPDRQHEFPFDSYTKECILQGYDDLDYLLSRRDEIKRWQRRREKEIFFSTLRPN